MLKKNNLLLLLLITFALVYCEKPTPSKDDPGTSTEEPGTTTEQPDPTIIKVNVEEQFQRISGFGGGSRMWGTRFLNSSEAETVFGLEDDNLGLSIFRIRIASDASKWSNQVNAALYAQSHGAIILASPWSPPSIIKSNSSDVGGYLPKEHYASYVDHINNFIVFMKGKGVDIFAISIQNEPDISVSYESCDWSAAEMTDFLENHGQDIDSNVKVAAPESFNFKQSYINTILNNDSASNNLDIVAGHIYGGGLAKMDLAEKKNKEIWMTEYLLNLNTGQSGAPEWSSYNEQAKWKETIEMLRTIHVAMESNWNAYIWWYIRRYYSFIGDGSQGTNNGEILKRGFAFSHYSKYVRPGFLRVGLDYDVDNLDITAYKNSEDKLVVVVLNKSTTQYNNVQIQPQLASVKKVESFTTTVSLNRSLVKSSIKSNNVNLSILPESITTVVIN